MAISTVEGSQLVSTTEWALPDDLAYAAPPGGTEQTDDAVLQVWLDLSELQSGDQFRCRLYEVISTGGTQRLVEEWNFNGAQSKPGWVMPSVIVMHGWDITLWKVAGTDRTITWSIRKVS